VVKVLCPTGIEAWLVTRYADVRAVMGDPVRFSNHPGQAGHIQRNSPPDAPMMEGAFFRMDGPDHVRFRRVFAPAISTIKRVEQFQPLVQRIFDERLDEVAASGGPIDFHEDLSKPVTTAVIAELLGVPYADRALFQRTAEVLFDGTVEAEVLQQSIMPLFEYMYGLLVRRKAEPGDDVFSVMIERGQQASPPMTDIELITMAAGLLVAGHDTTASLITYGTLALLQDPERYAELRENPDAVPNAIEEMLRYLSNGTGLLRVATVDTELAGVPIKAGDYVVVAIHTANHDPAQFDHPERLDFERGRTAHLGFGHGPHQCVGQQIARLELKAALSTLPRRVPSLRLAVPFEQIEFKQHTTVVGPQHLPVTWDEVLPS